LHELESLKGEKLALPLVFHHREPFDRMLIAQAGSGKLVLMTADLIMQKYPVEILWCGK
jgi:PIN domain nuclease of toxin-antitoxin system